MLKLVSGLRASQTVDTMYLSARLTKRIGEDATSITNGVILSNYVEFCHANENYFNTVLMVIPYVATVSDLLSMDFLSHGSNMTYRTFIGKLNEVAPTFGSSYLGYYRIG